MRLANPLLALTAALLTALPAHAAAPEDRTATLQTPKQTTASTLQVYSRETVVDVTVTDNKGQPVHGLTQADFSVKEDGKPQTIHSFKEAGSANRGAVRVLPKLPEGVYSNAEEAPPSGPVHIILLDLLNTPDPAQMVIVKRGVANHLKAMRPGTQVAVFELSSNKGLSLLQGFTSDGVLAAASAERLDVEWVRPPKELVQSAAMTFEAMQHLGAYVSGIKGRKDLLWFTAYMPILLTRDGGSTLRPEPPFPLSYKEVSELYEALAGEQVAVYPIDAGGLSSGIGTVPSGTGVGMGRDLATNRSMAAYQLGSGVREKEMLEVADQTGGLMLDNSSDFNSLLGRAIEHGSNYYTLSYVPPPFTNDTRYHTIDVKVDRPGLHLVYRKGYNAVDPSNPSPAPGPKLMQAAMGGGVPPATQLLFDVRVGHSTELAKPTDPPVMGALDPRLKKAVLSRYSFLYLLPMSQISFADGPDGTHSGSLEFDVAAYDADGKLATMISQTMKLPLTADEYQQFVKTPFQFLQQLDLPPGQMTLRIGILDGVSNKVGTLEIPLTVGKGPAVVEAGR